MASQNEAETASRMFITHINRFRSTVSTSAPASRVKRKKGSEATVDINDRNRGEVATMFMVQVAAVSCAATQVPDSKLANQS